MKKKTYTVKGHRQIQKEKEQLYKSVQEEYANRMIEIKNKILSLFPELTYAQLTTTVEAGFDVTLETKVSAKALLEILRV